MTTSDSNNNKWLDERLEAFLDNELVDEERLQFERLLEADAGWQQELSWAESIRDELRAIPTPEVPPHLESAIMKEVLRDARSGYWSRFISGLNGFFSPGGFVSWKPAMATGMLLIVATVLLFIVNRPDMPSSTPETISQAEVDQALAEAKWALGYVSKTGRLTGTSMQDALAPLLKERTKE